MADADEKARKIAAAKKRVEQMKKKKKSETAKKTKEEPSKEEEDVPPTPGPAPEAEAAPEPAEEEKAPVDDKPEEDDAVDEKAEESSPAGTPSLAQQSKLRSTSFRAGGPGVASPPDGDTAPDIYRKHVARIEELEKENKRLEKESADAEKRWKKAEEELADLREAEGDDVPASTGGDDIEKLKSDLAALERQNTQLQQQVSRTSGHVRRSSVSITSPADLQAELDSKSSTIESMEIEISKLKARVERHESGATSEKEQVTALEEKLARAEAAAGKAQRELQDLKRNLDRTAEKAVREGSERTSAETKVRTLEQELREEKGAREELALRAESLEMKVNTLTTLHKEQDTRLQGLKKEKEAAEKLVKELRTKAEKLENENVKLRVRKSTDGGGGLDDEGVDELENEDRVRLEKKIRSLEKENHELRSGAWIEKRREMESTGNGFQDVDLSLSPHMGQQRKTTGGIGDFFTSGLNALAGTGGDDEFLEDDDLEFDEDAFRKAQEEESKNRLERIKEIKRALKHWEGWRLDIVDIRRGGREGIGEIFDV
ncbi:hypothetical protein V2G26_003040 [Clonostachys chloroleuca]|uniref:M protein repeat protein n=1 Tax=Clonostachys chloroleuca TaxID=1926264 RepID=A0AA35MIY0_9HYPO|nr:unnamed protein product [Clonostachys chloroleuca]